MILTPGSPNISQLEFQIDYDISMATPSITLTNASVGAHLNLCNWWVVITTPSGTPVHTGSSTSFDMVGAWSTWTMPESWPQPFNEIEWSGYNYVITVYVIDGAAHQYSLPKSTKLCRPSGNTPEAKNNFGVATFNKKIQINDAVVSTRDTTKYLYKDSNGTVVSQVWRMIYPADNEGNRTADMVVTGTSAVAFDISYTGEGYRVFLSTVVRYDLGDLTFITIAYKGNTSFNIYNGADLCGLICGYKNLINKVEAGQCGTSDIAQLRQNLLIINSDITICLIAIQNGCDIDLAPIIDHIKQLGGFDCLPCNITGNGVLVNSLGTVNITTVDTGNITSDVERVGNNFVISFDVPDSGGGGGAQNLQSVTDLGYDTTNDIRVKSGNFYSVLSKSYIDFITDVSTGHGGRLSTQAYTSFWTWKLPNKSGTIAMLDDIPSGGVGDLQAVTTNGHTTTQPIDLLSGGTLHLLLGGGGWGLYDGVSPRIGIDTLGERTRLVMRGGSVGTGTVNVQAPVNVPSSYDFIWPSMVGPVDSVLASLGGGGTYWKSSSGLTVYVHTLNADYVIPAANCIVFLVNNGLTANRTVTLPTANSGDHVTIVTPNVNNPAYGWSLNTNVLDFTAGATDVYSKLAKGISTDLLYHTGSSPAVDDGWLVVSTGGRGGKQVALHTYGYGAAPTLSFGAGAGTGATATLVAASNNMAGRISLNTGTTPATAAAIVTLLFSSYLEDGLYQVLITPQNVAANELLKPAFVPSTTILVDRFTLTAPSVALAASTTYIWSYLVVGSVNP